MTNDIFAKFPIIDLGDYIMREKELSDTEAFFEYYADPKVSEHIISYIPQNFQEAQNEVLYWKNFFRRKEGVYWGIAVKETNRLIGSIGLTAWNRHHNRAEISYDLSHHYWQQGIMTKAVQQTLLYGFNAFQINRIEAFTALDNIASSKLLEKSGFTLEGKLRQYRFSGGKYHDTLCYSILKHEFLAKISKNLS